MELKEVKREIIQDGQEPIKQTYNISGNSMQDGVDPKWNSLGVYTNDGMKCGQLT